MSGGFNCGDWAQTIVPIHEVNEYGERISVIGKKGAVVHVIDVHTNGLLEVYFERTRRVSVCAPEELTRLGGPETGRFPS